MRTNSNLKKSTIAKFAGLIVIVLCFVMIFSLILSFGLNGSEIAMAAERLSGQTNDPETGVLGGASTTISGANGNLTAEQFGFPGINLNTNTWSFAETIDKGSSTSTNVSFYSGIHANGGKDSIWIDVGYSDFVVRFGTNSSGYMTAKSYNWFFGATNYQTSAFLRALIENPYFEVSANVTAYIILYDYQDNSWTSANRDDDYYLGVKSVQSVDYLASDAYNERTSSYFGHGSDSWKSSSERVIGDFTSPTATLTSENPNLAIGFGVNFSSKSNSNRDMYMTIRDLRINFTIKYVSGSDSETMAFKDGSAPVKTSVAFGDYSDLTAAQIEAVEKYSPYITNVADMPVYYDVIASQLAQYKDQILSNGDAVLSSFISTSNNYLSGSTIGNSSNFYYYKSASVNFVDTYNYLGIGGAESFDPSNTRSDYLNYAGAVGYTRNASNKWVVSTDSNYNAQTLRMASGIKSVVVTASTATAEGTISQVVTNISSSWYKIEVTDDVGNKSVVGFVNIKKDNRASVTFNIYVDQNVEISMEVSDYGDQIGRSNITFNGIDRVAPTYPGVCDSQTSLENDGYISQTAGGVESMFWYKDKEFESEAASGEEDSDDAAPYVWFYSVQKADTIDGLKNLTPYKFASYLSGGSGSSIKDAGILPIAYGTFTSFAYDFEKGRAIVRDVSSSSYEVANPYAVGNATGVGYYMFTFYKVDIAGNLGETSTQYVKADYIKPSYQLNFSYTLPGESSPIVIDNVYDSFERVNWALGEAKLVFTINDVNFSGNTIRFEDADKEYILTFDRKGNLALFEPSKTTNGVYYDGSITETDASGRLVLTISTYLESTKIYFTYSCKENYNGQTGSMAYVGTVTVEFEGATNGVFPTVAWMTGFNLTTVAYENFAAADNDDVTLSATSMPEAKIFIDRNNPTKPMIQDSDVEKAFIVENNYTIDLANKLWKTDNYILDSILMFDDFVADVDLFSQYVKVYTAFKYVNSVSDFEAMRGKVESVYQDLKSNSDAIKDSLLDRLYITTMNRLSNGSSTFPIEFSAVNGSGMRVVYIWVEDQAGRVSELYSCYVLIDVTNYSVSSEMLEAITKDGKNFGENGTISANVNSIKRGDTVTLKVSLSDGYVPYLFNKNAGVGSGIDNLLVNYTPNKTMLKAGGAFDSFVQFSDGADENTYEITFVFDDNDVLGALNSNVLFTMSARKVVSKTPSYNKYYDATVLNMKNYVILSDANAMDYLEFEYFSDYNQSSNSGTVINAPINVGTYYIRITIPQDNEAFVMSYTANDAAAGFIIPIQFSIATGLVTITPVATVTQYGDVIELKYNISGFNFDNNAAPTGEYLMGSIKLNVADWNPNMSLNVGPYSIVQDTQFVIRYADGHISSNFNVVFTENVVHTVTQREVVINVWEESKEYGDLDKDILFSVNPEQFGDWYQGNIDSLMNVIFNGYTASDRNGTLYLYYSNGRITRVKGENVGKYAYIASSTFDVNSNYKLVLSVENTFFTITQRNVTIDASGQYSVIKYSQYDSTQSPDISGILLNYTLASKDVTFADYIANAVKGLLNLRGGTFTSMSYDGYFGRYTYEIMLGEDGEGNTITTQDGNMVITLVADDYYIYVAEPGSVIIKIKDGATFEFVYGLISVGDIIYKNLADKFEIVYDDGEVVDFDEVSWSISLTSDGQYLNAGSYNVSVYSAELYKGGNALPNKVLVNTFTVKVDPAEIVVRPTAYADNSGVLQPKTYGEEDSVYGINFTIVSVNGVEFNYGSSYAGITSAELRALISGAYARGRYAKNGELRSIGERYDDATDSNGVILAGNEGDYYSFTVSTVFASSNSNFSVKATLSEDARFVINPKDISLDVKDFVGISKAYDETANVSFGSAVAYNLSDKLVRASDDIRLAFNAVYDKVGSVSEQTRVSIIFTNLHLEGASAHNYKLDRITNETRYTTAGYTGEFSNKLLNGDTVTTSTTVSDNIKVIIYYITNSIFIDLDDSSNYIYINLGAIAIFKSDFSVSKVYDGNDGLVKSDVSITNRSDENGGSTMLNQLWSKDSATSTIVSDTRFSDSNAGEYLVDIVLRFNVNGVNRDNLQIKTDGVYYDPDITIEVVDNAINISVRNLSATIVQKVFGVDSFLEINPVDQDYSGQAGGGRIKTTEVILKEGEVVDGDVIKVDLVSMINDGDFNARTHTVEFAPMGDGKDNTSYINNSNYTIDIDALNNYYSGANAITVNINKAKLIPNLQFVDREYNGDTAVETQPANSDFNCAFITENFAAELKAELERLHLNSVPTYKLSANGVENANVVTDENGNVIAHNILVQNVYITVEGDLSILDNYVMSGGRYDLKTKEYDEVEAVANQFIDDYELIGAVNITRKTLRLLSNNVIIKDKIYDSTNIADVKITLEGSGIANEEQAQVLQVTAVGKFAKNSVSDNVPVTISDVSLVVTDEQYSYLLNNYILPNFTERRNANILPRPIGVTVNLGEKTYSGDAQISTREVAFTLDREFGMIGNEADGYAVQTMPGYAYYIDKNVNAILDSDNNVIGIGTKDGTVFNPILRNSRGVVNYELVIATTTLREGEEYIAYVDSLGNLHYGETYTGDGSVTYYYSLPIANQYIEITSDNDSIIELAMKAGAVAGRYVLDGKEVYAVDSKYTGTVTGTMSSMTYVKGEGRINQKAVSISASDIVIRNESAFTKMYDGTTYFFGVADTNDEEGDYYYRQGGISGVIAGDDVYVTGVKAEYETAYTTANYVIFTPSGIDGKDVTNYRIDGKIGFARIRGSITKRPIDANLEDGTVEYGTAINTIVGKITYYAHGNSTEENPNGKLYELVEWEKDLYLPYVQYTEMMGFELGNYQDALLSRIYAINKNESGALLGFDLVQNFDESKAEYYFIKLSGITTLPVAKATFSISTPQAGDESNSYILTNANVTNYIFVPVYSGNGQDGSSKLTVDKKDIYLATLDKTYSKYYAGNEPNIELLFLDKNGNVGFAPSETAYNVFVKNGVNYAPVIRWGIYDKVENTWVMLGAADGEEIAGDAAYQEAYRYAKISSELGDNKEYMARFFIPTGVDYSEIAPNYNVILGTEFKKVDDDRIVLTYGEDEDGNVYELQTTASVLQIKLPDMGGVSLRGAENNTFSYTYDGKDHASDVVIGTRATDVVTLEKYSDGVVNAGAYVGVVSVMREIKVDNNDPNNYFNLWTSEQEVTINILKASPQLKAVTTSRYYDGTSYEYEISGKDNMISYLAGANIRVLDGYADITYEFFNGEEYVPVTEMRDAGTYRVSVALNDKFAANNPNYVAETAVATYTILRSLVYVSISSEGYQEVSGSKVANGKTLSAAYDSSKENYVINYTISNMEELPQNIQLPISQTELVFEKNITSAGRYAFAVKITDGALDKNNYRLVNEIGVLELTTQNVDTDNASVSVSTAVVANKLVAKEVVEGKGTGMDVELWSKINEYMPFIDSQAKLSSVVRLELYCDDNLIIYDGGNINVSVAIPGVVGDLNGKAVYTVTAEGGLKLLTDYTVNDGRIEYTTDYLGTLVFVDLTPDAMPLWQIILIVIAVLLVVIAITWTVVALVIRKSRLKKLA